MVNGILQHAWHGAIVFRGNEQQAVSRLDLALQPLHRRCLVAVIILIVERQITDGHLLEGELWRPQLGQGGRQFAVEGILA